MPQDKAFTEGDGQAEQPDLQQLAVAFVAGFRAGERNQSGEEMLASFTGLVFHYHPELDATHEGVKYARDALLPIALTKPQQ